ncbi:conserved Plasmodium protein, unknown function [Plasmodium berghei]|uniref:Rhoptry protein, putative n=2 Tax=Plasmodium berghei TaxID=5821 RepID=A0A509AWL9_PLABA|nr:rhoptry protein, putative [Plasmodium berghei ANKA]CXI93844.1 conserved Plasmodium protein, unknown function [Plasmodium berghei]SCL96909.1 conserved Plasmodium protein, unknown function [Plasmodium berghei]SCM16510.1 conserved Plasmodium protein, unknown function [Plasmodium berghei]SCM18304.1 conserved Plasmodium protein, unknown function [Plasmodium berghei]SCN27734.1 conserved Plasmodium protein, unknown function [Plasmodium berghei]|eukprot:XP_034423387.1 rhoptry protein, putative [Plasmodium berghei ANKA]
MLTSKDMKSWTMRRFLCFSIGTATIIYALLLIVLSILMITHMSHYNETLFIIISIFNCICSVLIFMSITHKNAFTAYIAYNIVIMNYMIEAVEFLICFYHTSTSHSVQWYYDNFDWHRKILYNYNMYYGILEMIIHIFLFLISFFVIKLVWSFYRILQIGGNIFSFQKAEDIERILHGTHYYSYGTIAHIHEY